MCAPPRAARHPRPPPRRARPRLTVAAPSRPAPQGLYSILSKNASSAVDPCEVEIQSLDCVAPCPGPLCGQSFMGALGILAEDA